MNDRKRSDFAPRFCQGVSIGFQSFLRLLGADGRVLVRYQLHTTRISDRRLLSPPHGVFPASAACILALSILSIPRSTTSKRRTDWDSDRRWTRTILQARDRLDTLPTRPDSRRDRPKLTETSWQNHGRVFGHSIYNFLYLPEGHFVWATLKNVRP